jgi:hypothetical protein
LFTHICKFIKRKKCKENLAQPALAKVAMAVLPLHAAIAVPLTYKIIISHQKWFNNS